MGNLRPLWALPIFVLVSLHPRWMQKAPLDVCLRWDHHDNQLHHWVGMDDIHFLLRCSHYHPAPGILPNLIYKKNDIIFCCVRDAKFS